MTGRSTRFTAVAALSLGLVACGGGGGSDDDVVRAVIENTFFRLFVNDGYTEVSQVVLSGSAGVTFDDRTLGSSCTDGGSAVMATQSGSSVGEGAFTASVSYSGPCAEATGAEARELTGSATWTGTGSSAGESGSGSYSATLAVVWLDSRLAPLSGTCTVSGSWSVTSSTDSNSATITCAGRSFACDLAGCAEI